MKNKKWEKKKQRVRILAFILATILIGQQPLSYVSAADIVGVSESDSITTGDGQPTQDEIVPPVVETIPELPNEEEAELVIPQRDVMDWTNQTQNLTLSLEKIKYYDKSQEEVLPVNHILDISPLNPKEVTNFQLELGFDFWRTGTDSMLKPGDTFSYVIPKDYFYIEDTVDSIQPVDLVTCNKEQYLAGDTAAYTESVKIGSYVIQNNMVSVTITDEIQPIAAEQLFGVLIVDSQLNQEVLQKDNTVTMNWELQPGILTEVILPKAGENASSETAIDGSISDIKEITKDDEAKEGLWGAIKSVLKKVIGKTVPESRGKGVIHSQTTENPADGFSKVILTVVNKEGGYSKGDPDLTVDFQFEGFLDNEYLEGKMEEFILADPNFPQPGRTETETEYRQRLDNYLNDPVNNIPILKFNYVFSDIFQIPENAGTPVDFIDAEGSKLGSYQFINKGDKTVLEVQFLNYIYNRSEVEAAFSYEMHLNKDKLKENEKVDVGFNDDTKLLELIAHIDPNKPGDKVDPKYTISKEIQNTKENPYKKDNPFVNYVISAKAPSYPNDTPSDKQKTLNGTYLSDPIPSGLEVQSVWLDGVELDRSQYSTEGGILKYTFPAGADPKVKEAEFIVKTALSGDKYLEYVNGASEFTFNNIAELKETDTNTSLITSEEVTAKKKMSFIRKEGVQDSVSGSRFAWTLDINTQFSTAKDSYVIDAICWSDQKYDVGRGVDVYEDGKYKKTISIQEVSGAEPYGSLTAELITATYPGKNEPFYYTYDDGSKTQGVLIIPFDSYTNKNIKLKYYTEFNLDGKTMGEYLKEAAANQHPIKNEAKIVWDTLTYEGIGVAAAFPKNTATINKDVPTNATIADKEAGAYDAKNQIMTWNTKVNFFGAYMSGIILEDKLDNSKQTLIDPSNISYTKRYHGTGTPESGIITSDNTQPIYYKLDTTSESGFTILKIYINEVLATEYYDISFQTKVKDPDILTTVTPAPLKNAMKATATVDGQPFENLLEAEKTIVNPLINKRVLAGFDYDTHELTWEVTINPNMLPVTEAKLTDHLPIGTTFKELLSVTRTDRAGETKDADDFTRNADQGEIKFGTDKINFEQMAGTTAEGYVKNQELFKFSAAALDHSYTFRFKTVTGDNKYLTDSLTEANKGELKIVNEATLIGNVYAAPVHVSSIAKAEAKIKNDLITKKGSYNKAEGKITWTVELNKQKIDLGGLVVTEQLGNDVTELDKESFKLSFAKMNPNGTVGALTDAPADWQSGNLAFTNNAASGVIDGFKFTIPDNLDYRYKTLVLTFDTLITDDYKGTIENKLTLAKGNTDISDTGNVDSGYVGDFNLRDYAKMTTKPMIQVIKLSDNSASAGIEPEHQIPLEGAEFTLTPYADNGMGEYPVAGSLWKIRATKDGGNLGFVNLSRKVVYEIAETVPPLGYQSTDSQYVMFTEGSAASASEVKQTLKVGGAEKEVMVLTQGDGNPRYVGNTIIFKDIPNDDAKIEFTKAGPNTDLSDTTTLLSGVKFTMKRTGDQADNVKEWDAVSDASGKVVFKNIDEGTYEIKENTGADGAKDPYMSNAVLTAKVELDKTTGNYSIDLTKKSGDVEVKGSTATGYTVIDKFVQGSISLYKTDSVIKIDGGSIPVEDAGFTLYEKADYVLNGSAATVIGSLQKTDSNGKSTFKNVPWGEYAIVETTYPVGYRHDALVTYLKVKVDDVANKKFEVTVGDANHPLEPAATEISNKRAVGTIKLVKKKGEAVTKPFQGRRFKLSYTGTDKFPFTPQEKITDANGEIIFRDVPYGDYKIEELSSESAGDNYKPIEPITVTKAQMATAIAADYATFEYSLSSDVTNKLLATNVELKKQVGGTVFNGDVLKDVTFKLQGKDYNGDAVSISSNSTETGVVEFANVPISDGSGYTLTEVRPVGYETPSPLSYNIKVVSEIVKDKNTAVAKIDPALSNKTIKNIPIKGKIEFIKKREGNPMNAESGLAGAKFALYAKHADGTVDTEAVHEVTSGTDGIVSFQNVEFGEYVLKEIEVPKGYEKIIGDDGITITKANLTTGIPIDNKFTFAFTDILQDGTEAIKNKLIQKDVTFLKTNQNKKPLNGVQFQVYRWGHGGINGSDVIIDTDSIINPEYVPYTPSEVVTSNADGVVILTGLPYGKYKLIEDPASVGLHGSAKPIIITIDEKGAVKITYENETDEIPKEGGITTVVNTLKYGYVQVHKVENESKRPLAGAEFTVYQADENDLPVEPGLFTLTTGEDGKFPIPVDGNYGTEENPQHLLYGEYVITETKVPAGYQPNNTNYGFEIGDTTTGESGMVLIGDAKYGSNVTYYLEGHSVDETTKLTNVQFRSTVTLKKVDAADEAALLDGAQFGIYDEEKLVASLQPADTKGMYALSNKNPDGAGTLDVSTDAGDKYLFDNGSDFNLLPGTYTIKETKAPEGYVKLTYPIKITVAGDGILSLGEDLGNVASLPDAKTLKVKNTTTKFFLNKSGSNAGVDEGLVPGAVLAVQQDGKTVKVDGHPVTFNTEEINPYEVSKLKKGTYQLVETKTPDGYAKAKPITFTLKDDNSIEVAGAEGTVTTDANGICTLTMINQVIYGHVTLTKTDNNKTHKHPLDGILFDLYKMDDTTGKTVDADKDVKIVQGLVTGQDEGKPGQWTSVGQVESIVNPDTNMPLAKGLSKGWYYFIERATTDQFVLDSTPKKFQITDENHYENEKIPLAVTMENVPLNASLRFQKVDVSSGEGIKDTEFKLYKKVAVPETLTEELKEVAVITTGRKGDEVTYFDAAQTPHTYTYKEDGEGFYGALEKGSYVLEETKAAQDYQFDDADHFKKEFQVTEDEKDKTVTVFDDTDTTDREKKTIGNKRVPGTMVLDKVGADNLGKALNDVTFTLYKKNDVDGNVWQAIGNALTGKTYDKLMTLTPKDGADGTLTIEGLLWGDYYIQETTQLKGYVLDDTKHEFTIKQGHTTHNFTMEKGVIKNHLTAVQIRKTNMQQSVLSGAEFVLSGKFADTPLNQKEDYRVFTSKNTNEFLKGQLIQGETYTLHETKAPKGYELAPEITFTMGTKGMVMIDGMAVKDNTVVMKDQPIEAFIQKVDMDGNKLRGYEFKISGTFANQDQQQISSLYVSDSSEESKTALAGQLVAGNSYTVEETKAPWGYKLGTEVITIAVDKDGVLKLVNDVDRAQILADGETIQIKNAPTELKIFKNSPDGRKLEGCIFGVTGVFAPLPQAKSRARTMLANTSSEVETIIVDDAHPDILKGRLISGNVYVLKEMNPPPGFEIGGEVKFKVEADGSIIMENPEKPGEYTKNESNNGIIDITMVDDPIEVQIAKTDMDGNLIAGAVFKMTGEFADGSKEKTITSLADKSVDLTEMLIESEEGYQYTLTELEAPQGYVKLDKPLEFKVTWGGTVTLAGDYDHNMITVTEQSDVYTVHLKNQKATGKPADKSTGKPNDPDSSSLYSVLTGDDNNWLFYLILLIMAGGAIVVIRYYKFKRK